MNKPDLRVSAPAARDAVAEGLGPPLRESGPLVLEDILHQALFAFVLRRALSEGILFRQHLPPDQTK